MAAEKTDKKGKKEVWGERLKKIFHRRYGEAMSKKDKLPREESYVVCHTDNDRERRRTDRSAG